MPPFLCIYFVRLNLEATLTTSDPSLAVVAGDNATFSCATTTSASLRWSRYATGSSELVFIYNGEKIPASVDSSRYFVAFDSAEKNGKLTIVNVQLRDSGLYRCQELLSTTYEAFQLVVMGMNFE